MTMLSKCPVYKKDRLEVAGMPRDDSNENLEMKVLEVFSKVGCEILSRDIRTHYRLTNNDRVIVKFLQIKCCSRSCQLRRTYEK